MLNKSQSTSSLRPTRKIEVDSELKRSIRLTVIKLYPAFSSEQIESECTRLFKQKLINNQSLVIRIDNTEEVTKKTEQLSSLNSASPKKLSVNNMAKNKNNKKTFNNVH